MNPVYEPEYLKFLQLAPRGMDTTFTYASAVLGGSDVSPSPMDLSVSYGGSVVAQSLYRPRLRKVSPGCWSAQEERRGHPGQYGRTFYGPTPEAAYEAWEYADEG